MDDELGVNIEATGLRVDDEEYVEEILETDGGFLEMV